MMAFYRADIPVRFKRAPAINSRYFVEADLTGLKNNFEEMREIMGGFFGRRSRVCRAGNAGRSTMQPIMLRSAVNHLLKGFIDGYYCR